MKAFIDTQELANNFNEDEAVWRHYEQKRRRRRLLGSQIPIPEAILDDLDWLAAERECRTTGYVGKQAI
ncbi:MAG: hypothetical protein OEY28_08060 [Nitrospira sp.]|nr:hypothetical protein [Nitrospira sp.]